MSFLIDFLKQSEAQQNQGYAKVLSLSDIDDVVKLYKDIYEELKTKKCEKFIHKLDGEEIEQLITNKSSAIVGYFKEQKHLIGALYTKPFEKDSQFFKSPYFEHKSQTYALGGLVVLPQFRGNGVVSKMANVIVDGVKDFANSNKNLDICGAGFEISCENFSSINSLGGVKNAQNDNVFNLLGIHYLNDSKAKDNDLTVLGYTSFDKEPIKTETPKIALTGEQKSSFENLKEGMFDLSKELGATTCHIDGHNIETLNAYIKAPMKEIFEISQN